jgi:ankyrin repeat protein
MFISEVSEIKLNAICESCEVQPCVQENITVLQSAKMRNRAGLRKLNAELNLRIPPLKENSLHEATKNGEFHAVEALLNQGLDPNWQNAEGKTALHIAAARGDIELIQLLLRSGADVTIVDRQYQSAFHAALDSNDPNVIYALCQNIKNLDVLNKPDLGINLITPLAKACMLNKKEMIVALLNCGAELGVLFNNDPSEWDGAFGLQTVTAMHFAAAACDLETLQFLIDQGPPFECYNKYPCWPIIRHAAESGNFANFKFLLDRTGYREYDMTKIFMDCFNRPKEIPYSKEMAENKLRCLTYMLDTRLTPELRSYISNMRNFIVYGDYQAVEFLVERGYFADFNRPLVALVNSGGENDFRIFKLFVERGADYFQKDCGSSLLNNAAQTRGSYGLQFVQFLIEHGLDVNEKDAYGRTILDVEYYITNREIYNYLISIGAKCGKDC